MEFEREILEKNSIHELREIARTIGVKSPTNKRKDVLIDAILKIRKNEAKPEFNNNKVGRPPRIAPHSSRAFEPYSSLTNPQNFYILNSSEQNCYGLPSSDEKGSVPCQGVLEIIPAGGFGMIRDTYTSDKVIYISKVLISDHKLKIGDYVSGKIKLNLDKESYLMISVEKSFNYELGYIREWFRDFIPCERNIKLNLPYINEFFVGKNNFIKSKSKPEAVKILKDIYNNAKENKIEVLAINFNSLESPKTAVSDFIDINFTAREENKIRAVFLAIEHAKRLVENRKDVVLLFNGLSEYLRVLDNFNKNQVGGTVMLQSVEKMKEVAGIATAFKDSSLTTIFVDSLSVPERYREVLEYDIIANMHKNIEVK